MIETTEKIPSKYQVDIYHAYDRTNSNLIIEAGPGSGKSFVLKELLKRTLKFKKCILVAFNKSIKDELESQVSNNVKVSTIHSLAYGILRRNVAENFKLTEIKNFILGRKYLNLDHIDPRRRDSYLFMISKIIDLAHLNLVETREDLEDLCNQYNISFSNGEVDDAMKMLKALDKYNRSRNHKEFLIDFTDMLWLTHILVDKSEYPKYNVVMCDELQDLNALQKEIVENIINVSNGRFVGVGDFHQSIYSFMGANVQAFKSFINRPNTIVLPLSVTYRCSKAVTDRANEIFEGLEAYEENCEGAVRKGLLTEIEEGDFLICRNNLPLVEAWINIIKTGKRANIAGKDFGQNLITLLGTVEKFDDLDQASDHLLFEKAKKLREKGVTQPLRNPSYQALAEKLMILKVLENEFESFEKMSESITNIFKDDVKTGVRLMTGHKSKGLEADRVFFLQKNLIPSKYAVSELELYQERCLEYVITTRAKKELIYID